MADSPPLSSPPPPPSYWATARRAPLNTILVGGCVALALWTSLGSAPERLLPFFISNPLVEPSGLSEIRQGEVWRLFTPAFIHFGIAHLLLNMLAMVNLGNPLERVQGTRFYLALTASIALCSNLGQYLLTQNAAFGGMSGVIFGLFGFLLVRAWIDKSYVLRLQGSSIVTTLLWFAFCFTGVLPIANGAHAVGLIVGALWGVGTGWRAVRRRQLEGGWQIVPP